MNSGTWPEHPTRSSLLATGISTTNVTLNSSSVLQYPELTTKFPKRYKELSIKDCNSSIGNISPFLDKLDILRVGGRISNANISFQIKHPLLLAKQHPISLLIFSEAH